MAGGVRKAGNDLEPAIIVIFGITGDLSQRYLLPSLYHLIKDGLLPEQTEILGITRGQTTTDELFEQINLCPTSSNKACDPAAVDKMRQITSMFRMDLDNPDDYAALKQKINSIEDDKGICLNRLYYLSIPPKAYQPVIHLLGQAELNTSCQHNKAATRLLVEKPFGFDLESAESLISAINEVFSEDQLFRIDHYLAKETVQNILTFRFDNPIFEVLWNREYISRIEIKAFEKIGVEGRAAFYDPLGALRDFIQSHLLQIMAIVTMDQPSTMDSAGIHASKQAVMRQIQPVPLDQVRSRATRGQYEGYREEVKNPESNTETYADVTVFIDSQRWQGVPIRLATGKAMAERSTDITVEFHNNHEATDNRLHFRLQPNEGIELDLVTKKPGFDNQTQVTAMNFSYKHDFDNHGHPDAYERVLIDAVRGDHTLFATNEEVLASWRVLQPVVNAWSATTEDLIIYKPGIEDLGQSGGVLSTNDH